MCHLFKTINLCMFGSFITLIAGFSIFLHYQAVAAQESSSNTPKGITISPPLKEIILNTGLIEAVTKITITNNSGRNVIANLRIVDFEATDELGAVTFIDDGNPTKYALASWVSLRQGNSVSIPNTKSVEVPVTIINGEGLAPGGHYGALVASIVTDDPALAGKTVTLKQQVTSLLFVKKIGGESYGLELESFNPLEYGKVPSEVSTRFKNTGNTHVVPRGYIEVKDPKGILVSKGILNPESTMILPDKNRQFSVIMQPVTDSSKSGRYTITAYYRYDGQNDFTTQILSFNKYRITPQLLVWLGIVATLMTGMVVSISRHRRRSS